MGASDIRQSSGVRGCRAIHCASTGGHRPAGPRRGGSASGVGSSPRLRASQSSAAASSAVVARPPPESTSSGRSYRRLAPHVRPRTSGRRGRPAAASRASTAATTAHASPTPPPPRVDRRPRSVRCPRPRPAAPPPRGRAAPAARPRPRTPAASSASTASTVTTARRASSIAPAQAITTRPRALAARLGDRSRRARRARSSHRRRSRSRPSPQPSTHGRVATATTSSPSTSSPSDHRALAEAVHAGAAGRSVAAVGDGAQHRGGLGAALRVLALGHRLGDDAGAGLHVGHPVAQHRRADRDRHVEVAGEVQVAHRSPVHAAAHRLELVDQLHRPRLRRAGQGAGGEGRAAARRIAVVPGRCSPVTVETRCMTWL